MQWLRPTSPRLTGPQNIRAFSSSYLLTRPIIITDNCYKLIPTGHIPGDVAKCGDGGTLLDRTACVVVVRNACLNKINPPD